MHAWFRFFAGTPQRFLTTMVVIGLIVVVASPGLLRMALERLIQESGPALGPMLAIAIVLGGLKVVVWGRK